MDGYEHGEFGGDGGLGAEDLSIDLDMLIDIMDEEHDGGGSDPNKNCLDESEKSASRSEADIDAKHQGDDLVYSNSLNVLSNLKDSKSRIGGPGGSTLKQDLIFDHGVQGSEENAGYASHKDWISLSSVDGNCYTENAGFSLSTCSTSSSVYPRDDGNIPEFEGKTSGQIEIMFGTGGAETNRLGVPKHSSLESSIMDSCKYDMFKNNSTGTMGATEHNFCTSMQFSFVDVDMSRRDIISKGPAICYSTGATKGYFAAQDDLGPDYPLGANYNSHIFSANAEPIKNVKNKEWGFLSDSSCSNTMMKLNDQRRNSEKSAIEMEGWDYQQESNDYTSTKYSSFDADYSQVDEKSLMQNFVGIQSYIYGEDQVKDEKYDELTVRDFSILYPYGIDEVASRREPSFSADYKYFGEDLQSSLSGISCSLSEHNTLNLMDEKRDVVEDSKVYNASDDANGGLTSFYGNNNVNMNARQHYMPSVLPFSPISNQSISIGSRLSKVSPESSHSNFSEKSIVDDDLDVCIIEDLSHPAPSSQSPAVRNLSHPYVSSQHSISNGNYMGVGGTGPKAKDERLLLRLLQDISQPNSEMTPPDGLLEVSLLRHQRIALAWMVQKETDGAHCSGGILADDQGLGKTISTISLILKERPPSYNLCHGKQDNTETLNLDEDDNTPAVVEVKEEAETVHETPKNKSPLVLAKGRPAAGTLIVCPTSVLRQWADELRNRVTRKANLSVLVYHGTNRTKDPCELAKYDVVLTTYSIVSMEVPKQPRADEDDEEREKSEDDGSAIGLSSSKKRKYPPSSDKKRSSKKGSDSAASESLARPLAKVGWFRVVLDEAQSIKNHRTQVARACWGLRAKRRWCLSGTPIQNAIDDLYSYFRFLKYDPFDSYKLFISYIKGPISKSPTNGYRKLQTILKTIMLRRTKGTLLDGEPIINLPPKSIELKKVDFSQEERDFYSRLEADSRAQFEEYAAAGTVKQNYVNILLMLLRLRQACDHPFLVKGVDSHSLQSSSVETAKKLSRDEQQHLLRCLEASLAICGICNDPPEDAVVSKCGHVFCNQCISEHLMGEDHQCPKTSCKARLNISSVFSNVTLNSCLQDQSSQGSSSGPKIVDAVSSSDDVFFKSSKIKAALDVLESLCGTHDCSSANSSSQITTDGSDGSPVVEQLRDIPEGQDSATKENSNSSVKVVGGKAIVFSQWTRMLDLLEVCLKNSSIKYRRLDGTMSVVARDKAVKDFNNLPEVTVMIMSLKAASLGLNMIVACHVLLLDLWWNPTTEDQAIDRAHRIGQTRPVTVLRLTVKDTVEDRILALQQKKREMVASAFGEDGTGGGQTRLTVEDLNYLFMT